MRIKTSELTEQGLMHVLSLPDLSWQTCGPIIEREKMTTEWESHDIPPEKGDWVATIYNRAAGHTQCSGPTPLIAAMRCLCASKLGDEVEVPDELA